MSSFHKEIFPISVFHGVVADNEKLKKKIIPYIKKTKKYLKPPNGWFTNNIATSFDNLEVNSIFSDGGDISKEVQKQYFDVIGSFFDDEWNVTVKQFWYNYYENGEYQEKHVHLGNYKERVHFACIHFLSFDPTVHVPVRFVDPLENIRQTAVEMNSCGYGNVYEPPCKEGDFLMFPGYLPHYVTPGPPTPGNPRITISFNVNVIQYGKDTL